jgi:pimeloyl-ACP methyl ester carboxylesterase
MPKMLRVAKLDQGAVALSQLDRGEVAAEIDLSAMVVPALMYCGDRDPPHDRMQEAARSMPRATLVSLAGLSHGQAAAALVRI